jgi:peroxiredoxin Q/BCP
VSAPGWPPDHYPRPMALHVGEQAPDFELPDETGTLRRLTELVSQGPLVLFFYPAAMTKGCTMESCHFRDLKNPFEDLKAQRVGISADPVEKQKRFSEAHSFDFPLLSDTSGDVARAYGVRRNLGPLHTKRTTFVIDTDVRIIEIIRSELRMSVHADRALDALRARAGS